MTAGVAAPRELPPLSWTLTQEQIDAYAEVAGASDPIHVDPEFAKGTPLGGTIGQGFLLFAVMAEQVSRGLDRPEPWLSDRRSRRPLPRARPSGRPADDAGRADGPPARERRRSRDLRGLVRRAGRPAPDRRDGRYSADGVRLSAAESREAEPRRKGIHRMQNYRRAGTGPTVVLQHGFLGGSGYWLPQIQYLCPRFDVIAPDLPGFASSARMAAPDSIDGFVSALIGLLDELGVGTFSLVGHSMGGSIAQQTALDHPDRLERVVFYGASSIGEIPGRFETIADSIEKLQEDDIDKTAVRFAKSWFLHGDDAPAFDFCLQAGRGATVDGATSALTAVRNWSSDDRLHEITTPALVICGDGDRGTPPQRSMRLFEGLPNARLAILPGAAHNLHLERPEFFNQVVGDFLTGGM